MAGHFVQISMVTSCTATTLRAVKYHQLCSDVSVMCFKRTWLCIMVNRHVYEQSLSMWCAVDLARCPPSTSEIRRDYSVLPL